MRGMTPAGIVGYVRSSVSSADLDALRTAIGGGVVLPYALALAPAQPLTAGTLTWPWEHAHRVLHEWRTWTRAVADDVTSVARLVRAPHVAGVPAALRGRSLVVVDVAITGEPGVAAARLAGLRRLDPEADTVAPVAAEELLARQVPRTGVHAIGEHLLLRELPAAAVDAFIAFAGPGSRTPLVSAELRHLGGAELAVAGIGVAGDPDEAERVRISLEQLVRRLAPWTAGAQQT
jgi:hypothetical protein